MVADLTRRLRQRCRQVAVIALRGESDLSRQIAQADVPVTTLGLQRGDPRQLSRLVAAFRQMRPTIVHTHLMGANLFGRAAAVIAGVPALVVHDHESSAEVYTHPGPLLALRRLAEPTARPHNLRYLVVSQRAAEYAREVAGWPTAQIRVVPNGVDVAHIQSYPHSQAESRAALGLPQHVPLIGFAGRLRPVKGADLLLDALAQLPGAHLLIAGDGPQAAEVQARAERDDLAGRVHMLGQVADLRPALRACDVYAQPSRREAFGLAAAEAAAAGLPVVATAVGGLRDIVQDGRSGRLVPPERPDALSAALAHLLSDRELARRMGVFGRAYVEEHLAIETVVGLVEQVYDELLAVIPRA